MILWWYASLLDESFQSDPPASVSNAPPHLAYTRDLGFHECSHYPLSYICSPRFAFSLSMCLGVLLVLGIEPLNHIPNILFPFYYQN